MTVYFLRIVIEVILAVVAITVLLQLARRKVLVAGRFLTRKERPVQFWLWLAVDGLAAWFLVHLLQVYGWRPWP